MVSAIGATGVAGGGCQTGISVVDSRFSTPSELIAVLP
jgi:hypothetical protein